MTAQTLINEIRNKTGDKSKQKWDDSRVINVINEGLRDMGKKANVKKSSATIPVLPYQRKLVIPDTKFVRLLNAKTQTHDLLLKTFENMDKFNINWESLTGENLVNIVYNNQNPKDLTLYPLLTEAAADYDAINGTNQLLIDLPGVTADDVYGLIVGMDIDDIITPENVYDPVELEGYEPIMHLSDVFINVYIQYYVIPDYVLVAELDNEVDLDESYVDTLIYYVSGMLLFDDNRAESLQKAGIFINKYNSEIVENIGRNAEHYQQARPQQVSYRTGFENEQ